MKLKHTKRNMIHWWNYLLIRYNNHIRVIGLEIYRIKEVTVKNLESDCNSINSSKGFIRIFYWLNYRNGKWYRIILIKDS